MKQISKLLLLCLPFIAFLASCSSSGGTPSPPAYMTASSTAITTFSVTGTSLAAAGALGAKVQVTGTSSGGQMFTLYIKPCSATGIYPFSTDNIGATYQYPVSGASMDSVVSSAYGTLNLTSVTPVVAGTYTFTGTDSAVFTGSFSVATP